MSLRLRFLTRSTKASNGVAQASTASTAMKMPEELIRKILRLLTPDAIQICHEDDGIGTGCTGHKKGSLKGYLALRRTLRITLFRAILVCRTWYSIGTEVLYCSPILTSHSQLHHFARTVQNSSCLAGLVKNLIVFDTHPPKRRNTRVQWQEKSFADVYSILSFCPLLLSADFWSEPSACHQTSKKGGTVTDNFLINRLHELAIQGEPFLATHYRFQSPEMEVVRLHSASCGITSAPFLPPLHLRHVSDMPPFSMVGLGCGAAEVSTPLPVRDIAIGPVSGDSDWLSHWKLPSSLETLTIFLKLSETDISWDPAIGALFLCLSRSFGHAGGQCKLRTLDVFLDPRLPGTGTEEAAFAFDNVRYACNHANVDVQIHEERKSIRCCGSQRFRNLTWFGRV